MKFKHRKGAAGRDVTMVAMEVRWGGTVRVGGAPWGYVAGKGVVFAGARMVIPDGMTRSPSGDEHVQRSMDAEGPVVFEASRALWADLCAELRGLELECGKAATISADGVSYDRALVEQALDFVSASHAVAARMVDAGGHRCLRMESPEARALIAPCIPVEGGPGAALLDEEAMAALASTSIFDAPGDAVTSRGGDA